MNEKLMEYSDYKAGETIVREEPNTLLIDPMARQFNGILVMTNYRLLFWKFSTNTGKSQFYEKSSNSIDYSDIVLNLPLGFIQEFERTENSITLKCKDFRTVTLKFKSAETNNEKLYKVLERNLNPRSFDIRMFCFVHYEALHIKDDNGYNQNVITSEFQRTLRDREHWRMTKINHNFDVCETYPDEVGVPQDVSDELISNACQFRTKNRFPVLCWIHPDSKATLTRSSQPASGMAWKRNDYDEKFLKNIKDANAYNNLLTIIDCRPMINARANMARGGGIENQTIYQSISYEFLNIPNIHVMRESQRKLADLIRQISKESSGSSNIPWQKSLDDTRWLNYIRQILLGGLMVAEKINSQRSVLVHCSDGWDRTAQIVSLPQIMLDPHFRTIRGFQTLVDKEWLLMGHKMSQRTGGLSEELSSNYRINQLVSNASNVTAVNTGDGAGSGSISSATGTNATGANVQVSGSSGATSGGFGASTAVSSSATVVGAVNPSSTNVNPKSERAPIFLQFIDCVWQMTVQFPSSFEFNEQFLVELLDAVHSGLYGNFLFNCEQQRRQHDIYNKTLSFWTHVNNNIDRFSNPLYTSADESGHRVLFPQYRLPCIKFWKGYYLRHMLSSHVKDPIVEYTPILNKVMRKFRLQLNMDNGYDPAPTNQDTKL